MFLRTHYGSWLIDETEGIDRFKNFLEDEREMAYVFQQFVYNFLKIERPDLRVRRENILWKVSEAKQE